MLNLTPGGTPPLPCTESETSCCFLTKLEADSNLGFPKHISKVASTTPKPFGEFIACVAPLCCIQWYNSFVGCYGSLTGTSAICSHHEWHLTLGIFSLQEKPLGFGACLQKTILIPSWWGTWAHSHHGCSSAHSEEHTFCSKPGCRVWTRKIYELGLHEAALWKRTVHCQQLRRLIKNWLYFMLQSFWFAWKAVSFN